MAKVTHLHDLYAFPGFVPAATVRGVFGDPYALVISLRRRRKKRAVVAVGPAIVPSTTRPRERSAISIAVAVVSSWSSPSVAFTVASARP
jgi:hypothetical protein